MSSLDRRDLRRLATLLGQFIGRELERTNSAQADVIAHSMGGLLVRGWMAGLADVPYDGQIRRLILAGTPNFGECWRPRGPRRCR